MPSSVKAFAGGYINVAYLRARYLREDVRAFGSSRPPVSFVKCKLIRILDYSAHRTGNARANSSTWWTNYSPLHYSPKSVTRSICSYCSVVRCSLGGAFLKV